MNILQVEDMVKGLPDDRLFTEAKQPSGQMPQFLVVSEIQRRTQMRKQHEQETAGMPEGTVADKILGEGIAAIAPKPGGPQGMPPQGPPQRMLPPGTPNPAMSAQPTMAARGRPPAGQPNLGMAGGGIVRMYDGSQVPTVRDGQQFDPQYEGPPYSYHSGITPPQANQTMGMPELTSIAVASGIPVTELMAMPPEAVQNILEMNRARVDAITSAQTVRNPVTPPLVHRSAGNQQYEDPIMGGSPPSAGSTLESSGGYERNATPGYPATASPDDPSFMQQMIEKLRPAGESVVQPPLRMGEPADEEREANWANTLVDSIEGAAQNRGERETPLDRAGRAGKPLSDIWDIATDDAAYNLEQGDYGSAAGDIARAAVTTPFAAVKSVYDFVMPDGLSQQALNAGTTLLGVDEINLGNKGLEALLPKEEEAAKTDGPGGNLDIRKQSTDATAQGGNSASTGKNQGILGQLSGMVGKRPEAPNYEDIADRQREDGFNQALIMMGAGIAGNKTAEGIAAAGKVMGDSSAAVRDINMEQRKGAAEIEATGLRNDVYALASAGQIEASIKTGIAQLQTQGALNHRAVLSLAGNIFKVMAEGDIRLAQLQGQEKADAIKALTRAAYAAAGGISGGGGGPAPAPVLSEAAQFYKNAP